MRWCDYLDQLQNADFFFVLDLTKYTYTIYKLYWHPAETFIVFFSHFYQGSTVFLVILKGNQEST